MPNRAKERDNRIGQNIARLRKQKGLTQEQLAEKAGLSSTKMIETGARVGRIETLRAIAGGLNEPLAAILTEDQEGSASVALAAFLEMEIAESVTEAEIELMTSAVFPGLDPTPQTFHLLLLAIRASKPRPPSSK